MSTQKKESQSAIDKAVKVVYLSLLGCSHPTLTKEDIRGNAAVIVGNLRRSGIVLVDREGIGHALDEVSE